MTGDRVLRRVLVVDDDEDVRSLAELALVDLGGLEACCAGDGAAALAAVTDPVPDLILMDLNLEREDGRTVGQSLRAAVIKADGVGGAVPYLVFLTAATHNETAGLPGEPGYLGLVRKPFDPMGLAEVLRTLWSDR